MNAIIPRHQTFGRYDRIVINGASYRYVRWEDSEDGGGHILQLSIDGLLEDNFRRVSDAEIAELQRRKNFKVEAAYYSKALDELRMRQDDSNLLAKSEEEVRTIFWKTEWCVRFHNARLSPSSAFRPQMTGEDIGRFIEYEKHLMNRWYIKRFGEARPVGRPVAVGIDADGKIVKERKPFDYPSPTALRNWLRLYSRAGERMVAFASNYHRCGNRTQLDAEVSAAIDLCVQNYAASNRPTRSDIHEDVAVKLTEIAKVRSVARLTVSPTTINRRINLLEPYEVEFKRNGPDRAKRKYYMVGQGVDVEVPMQRVEMDDWEADLHTLLAPTEVWAKMSAKERAAVPRVRMTVTAAIDCRTKCIVGLNVSETAPSTPAAISALKSITMKKTLMTEYVGSSSDWPMYGRPMMIVTDGGPVFKGAFEDVVHRAGMKLDKPAPDPRQRGSIESFFKFLRRVCRYFSGRTYSNVVEKGDYDSEAMASLTVEEFRKAIITFIVDIYHHRGHRGLEGDTPYNVWKTLTSPEKGGEPGNITPTQRRVAFGFAHRNVRLDRQGVLYLGISYASDGLAELMRKIGYGTKVDLVIDPEELGDILVYVPARFRKHMEAFAPNAMYGEYLEVGVVNPAMRGKTLAKLLMANENVIQFAKEAQLKGEPHRLAAHTALSELALEAARRAGLPTMQATDAVYRKAVAEYGKKAKQATGEPVIGDEPPAEKEEDGESVATSKRKRVIKAPAQKERPESQTKPADRGKSEQPPSSPPSIPPSKSIYDEGDDD